MHGMVHTKFVPHSGRSIVGPTMRQSVRSWPHVRSFEPTQQERENLGAATNDHLIWGETYFYNRLCTYIKEANLSEFQMVSNYL